MLNHARLIGLHAITFLHPGTGQTTGVVDLPIQREIHTGFPMIGSSGLKGSLRDKAEQKWGKTDPKISIIFGSEDAQTSGALAVSDGRILAFPVRSLQKVFVWVTCPMVLRRLERDIKLAGGSSSLNAQEISIKSSHALVIQKMGFTDPLVLEELSFALEQNEKVREVADLIAGYVPQDTVASIRKQLVIIPDEDFQYLVRHATQVSARIRLNDKKTTTGDGGNLWYEETLPPETLLYTFVLANPPRNGGTNGIKTADEVKKQFEKLFNSDEYLQLGGNETVGQGWCRVTLVGRTQTGGVS